MEQFAPGERVAWRNGTAPILGVVVSAWRSPRGKVVGWVRLDQWPDGLPRTAAQLDPLAVFAFAEDCEAELWR